MTCVLSMTSLFPFSEDVLDLQSNGRDNCEHHWINPLNPNIELSDNNKCSSPCRIEACTGSSVTCREEISTGLFESTKHEQCSVQDDGALCSLRLPSVSSSFNRSNVSLIQRYSTSSSSAAAAPPPPSTQRVNSTNRMCNNAAVELDRTSSHGVKRKVDEAHFEDVYIPPKRVSPFLNTPKGKADERKKIIKLSSQKLKEMDDPETFLRRAVLVNNTMKRLQKELRQEKLKHFVSNKRRYVNEYGILGNNSISNTYLVDYPVPSGVHEKITDDMTDTLVKNVFHDKPDKRTGSDPGENLDIVSTKMEILEVESSVETNILTSLAYSENNSKQCSSDCMSYLIKPRKKMENRTDMEEISIDIHDDLQGASRCNWNRSTKHTNTVACENCLLMQYSHSNESNSKIPLKSTVKEFEIGAANKCDLNQFDIGLKLNHDSLFHSINHSIPVS